MVWLLFIYRMAFTIKQELQSIKKTKKSSKESSNVRIFQIFRSKFNSRSIGPSSKRCSPSRPPSNFLIGQSFAIWSMVWCWFAGTVKCSKVTTILFLSFWKSILVWKTQTRELGQILNVHYVNVGTSMYVCVGSLER